MVVLAIVVSMLVNATTRLNEADSSQTNFFSLAQTERTTIHFNTGGNSGNGIIYLHFLSLNVKILAK